MEGIEITQLIDASSGGEDQQRVEKVAKFLRFAPERQSYPDFKSVDALIVEVGLNARTPFQIGNLIPRAIDAGVHLHLPYDTLTALPYERVTDLFARAESKNKNVVLLACSRFLFGQCYTRFREGIISFDFGGVRDANFRIGIGPVRARQQLLAFGIHHLNILFDILPEKPIGITAVSSVDPLSQPCVNFTMRFARGEIANFFLTANRLWGGVYHWLEISGRNAYAATDLITRRYRTGIDAGTQISETNDDDQGTVLFGSAGKLRQFTAAAAESNVSAVANFSKITKRSLWVYRTLNEMLPTPTSVPNDADIAESRDMSLTNTGIATRNISTDASDGWQE